jgi:hypothetical protein
MYFCSGQPIHFCSGVDSFMHKPEACVKMSIGWAIGAARGDWEAAHPRQKGGEATAQETHAT